MASGVTGTVTEVNDNQLVATAGWAKPDPNEPVSTGSYIRIGSATKPFVATVSLHLVAQHRLALDDTVARWAARRHDYRFLLLRRHQMRNAVGRAQRMIIGRAVTGLDVR
jgi:CubicO group peptidase (beta-lactamase class C family)